MSFNVGGIYVRAKAKVDVTRVRAAICAYWTERGAKQDKRVAIDEPLSLARTGKLAFAVLPAVAEWICIADSERYNADFGLASYLATTLGTQVYWYTLYGATDGGVVRILGPGRTPSVPADEYGEVEDFVSERFPHAFVYFDKLPKKAAIDGFSGVDPTTYDRGPVPDHATGPPSVSVSDDSSTWPIAVPPELVRDGHLRLGLLVAFFLPGEFRRHVKAVSALFDHWLTVVPETALQWARVGASSSSTKPVNAQTIGRCRAQLTDKVAAKYAAFHIGGPETACPQHQFDVNGSVKTSDDVARGGSSTVQIRFPWGTSSDAIFELARRAAELLPYGTGLATPALELDANLSGDPGRPVAARLAVRHPGLELHVHGWKLGDHTHGAHWLVFLGPAQVKSLGDAITRSGVPAEPAGHGICLRASHEPELGDLRTGTYPSGMRAMAELLRSVTAPAPEFPRQAAARCTIELENGSAPAFEQFQTELGARWSARFVDDPRELAPYASKLETLERIELEAAASLERIDRIDLIDAFVTALAGVPYVSDMLGEHLLRLVRTLVERGQHTRAERITSVFPVREMLQFVRYRDRIKLLIDGSGSTVVFEWFLQRIENDQKRARTIASFGAAVVSAHPALAPAVVAAMPADADREAWNHLLDPICGELARLSNHHLEVAENLSDDIQPVARHNPTIYLWTATTYLKCERLDDAMTQLELAFEHGYDDLARITRDEDFAPLFRNPRFQKLKKR